MRAASTKKETRYWHLREANCPSAATISARLPVCVLRHITVSRPRLRPDDNQADFGVCPINRQENG
jgi:hypothetical protein